MCVCVCMCVHVQERTAESQPTAEQHACSMSGELSGETETPSWSLPSFSADREDEEPEDDETGDEEVEETGD